MDKTTCILNCALSYKENYRFEHEERRKLLDLNIILKGGRPIQIHYRF